MSRLKFWQWGGLLLLVPLVGCRTIDVPDPEGQRRDGEPLMNSKTIEQNAGVAQNAASSANRFGLGLLATVAANSPRENVFISPTSAWSALAMTRSGAAGPTKTEFSQVLEIKQEPTQSIVALRGVLEAQGAVVRDSNAIWADKTTPFAPTFVTKNAQIFGAKASNLDFKSPASVDTINNWVKKETEGKIENLIQQLPDSGAVLTNTLYFRGLWETEFKQNLTQDSTFHLSGEKKKTLLMMSGERFEGIQGANFEGAILPYRNSTCQLWALLPNVDITPLAVIQKLDDKQLQQIRPSFETKIRLPRFSIDWSDSLKAPLQKMGLKTAFNEADLSPMGMPANSFLSNVIHKTRLEINEEGTVAAAATGVAAAAGAAEPTSKILTFDRPFVLLLRETKSGALLFAGLVNDPQPLP